MKWKILIVEDDINFRYAIRELVPWEKYDFEVVGEAVNGRQALEILKKKEVHIVLTDMEMPIMDGVALTAEIKKNYPNIRIIALSAFDDFGFVKESMRLGAEDYILKQDLNADTIIETLQSLCKKCLQEQRRELERHQFQKELLDYIQEKTPALYNADNPYSKMKTRANMLLCLLKSQRELRGQEQQRYGGELILCMRAEEDVWICLYQLPKVHRKSEETELQREILSRMKKSLPEEVQIGVSDLTGDFSKLPDMYRMAKTALAYFMYFPEEQVIHYLDIRKFEETRIRNYLYQPPKNLLDVNSEELEQVLKEYENNLERYMPDESSINKGFVNIYGEFLKGVHEENSELEMLGYYEEIRRIDSVRDKFDHIRKMAQRMKPQYQKLYKGTHPEIRKALEYIALHYVEDISLHDIAEYVSLSENYFSNLFKQETGENLITYINKVRVENAKKILRNKSLKVYEVAEAVGYKNATYLSTMFKKITGISISEFKGGKGET